LTEESLLAEFRVFISLVQNSKTSTIAKIARESERLVGEASSQALPGKRSTAAAIKSA